MVGLRKSIQVIVKKPLQAQQKAKRVGDGIRVALHRGALRVEHGAKQRAPANFGRMRASIAKKGPEIAKTAIVYKVLAGAKYAKFVEFGTGPSGAKSRLLPVAREAMREMGYAHGPGEFFPPIDQIELWAKRKKIDPDLVFVIARAIGRRGIPAQPFLFPAFEEERPKIVDEIMQAARKAVTS
jgi:HK97 gp10 family phage protein